MFRPSWLLALLRRLISQNFVFRPICIFRLIWAVLRRLSKRCASWNSLCSPWVDDLCHRNVICASTLPIPILDASYPPSPSCQSCGAQEVANPASPEGDIADVFPTSYLQIEDAIPAGQVPRNLNSLNSPKQHIVMKPDFPSSIVRRRYKKNHGLTRMDPSFVLEKLTTEFPLKGASKDLQWTPMMSPGGSLFFVHQEKPIFTYAYLCDSGTLELVNNCVALVGNFDADKFELVLIPGKRKTRCGYYFVDHKSRLLVWPEKFDISSYISEVKTATSPAHIKHKIKEQYWLHWELFPNVCHLTQNIINELRQILVHSAVASMVSKTSTSPYSTETLRNMLGLVDNMTGALMQQHGNASDNEGSGSYECTVGVLMKTFAYQRFLNFHGENCARFCRETPIYSREATEQTLLFKMFSLVLIRAPNNYHDVIKKVCVDRIIDEVPWNQMQKKMKHDWDQYGLLSTVILTANVEFLAIGSVMPTGTLCQVFSYLSTIMSIGSIIASMVLLRQIKDRDTATTAVNYVVEAEHPRFGLELLAIRYSLPYALSVWSMVYFLLAFLALFFSQSNPAACLSFGIPSLTMAVLITWFIGLPYELEWEPWYSRVPGKCEVPAVNMARSE